ncbi:nucleotidyltransferase domain-containing protein [Candidatus Magnetomonas plexicatena]|uniref:nucleotidyltransferase domain-containing protein n=1 Tax=Candidatus Magnetomonas plexicatena TaxID=2552947 RepID=UPI001C77D5EE|nr:nucleotidyltransferase domain-containing protein [Nitrospirales bacterium LBB_01]
MTPVTEKVLREIISAIVDSVHPLKVILFGSYAQGHEKADSDLDFLVVEDEPFGTLRSRARQIGNIYRSLPPYIIPVDIVLYSKDESDKWKNGINHVIARACREGKVVYERS